MIDRLALDLQRAFPGQQGFSPRNLKYMRAFAEAWPETVMVQQPVAQIVKARKHDAAMVQRTVAQLEKTEKSDPAIVQAPLAQMVAVIVHQPGAQLPWKHHCLLLDKLTSPTDRLWYAAKAVEFGWSRDVLALQIDSGLQLRQGKAVSNFQKTLPPPQSDLAQQITKDPYVFDFLNWRQKSTARSQLKLAIEDVLDTGLPRNYSPEIYRQKCSALFEHIYEAYPEREASVYGAQG